MLMPALSIDSVTVRRGGAEVSSAIPSEAFRLYISASRLVLVCRNYDKGGGWLGFSWVTALANAVSYLRAKRRRKGKYMVAQVRLQWVTKIECIDQVALRLVKKGVVTLRCREREGTGLSVHLMCRTGGAPVRELAERIAAAAMAQRLRFNDGLTAAQLSMLAGRPDFGLPSVGTAAGLEIPGALPISAETAYEPSTLTSP
jgi:hypothetical protein